ncbi:hypothetical protein FB446DRAFT_792882 [Lentinula raphanica]|nr:hypothetical protein FB446DRAFT_792882 [Lentinula raphanica]KAJ3816725.1 hypothetical protein F5880DRAFT_1618998 [Lentinula raphanica]
MTKRPRPVLRAMYASRRARSTSPADGPGFLYVFVDNGTRYKVGMTKNFARRRAEWDRQCPCLNREWKKPIAVRRRRRAEALAHLLLELACFDRPYIHCPTCGKTHREIFLFNGNQANVWRSVVSPLLAIAANAGMGSNFYQYIIELVVVFVNF